MKVWTYLAELWSSITRSNRLKTHFRAVLYDSDVDMIILYADTLDDLREFAIKERRRGQVIWKGFTTAEFWCMKYSTYKLIKIDNDNFVFVDLPNGRLENSTTSDNINYHYRSK